VPEALWEGLGVELAQAEWGKVGVERREMEPQ